MDIVTRASRHAALGDPMRLEIVDDLVVSDRSPNELSVRHGVPSNLLAHHLDVLENAGLVERMLSSGDRRRRYVRLVRGAVSGLGLEAVPPGQPVVFVCTHNSARSQLAAALWEHQFGLPASSAGTHPADRVHPGAIEAGVRAGLDLTAASPKSVEELRLESACVITVCDQAHEELTLRGERWHWSTPDPAADPTPAAFDLALQRIKQRIETFTKGTHHDDGGHQSPDRLPAPGIPSRRASQKRIRWDVWS